MKTWLIPICILFMTFSAFGQKEIVTQNGAWFMYFGNHRLTEKWGIHTEYQLRRSDFVKDWQQSLARIGVDYHFNPQNSLTAGYGWIVSFPYGEQAIAVNTTEHRIWQQFINKSVSGRFNFNHRYRLEQRFIENASLNGIQEKEVDGYKFRQRARYRFMISIPITRKTMEDKTLFLSLYDEVFLGFGKGIGKNILDQNRLFGSIGWKFNGRSNVQLGYLNQMIFKSDGIHIERNHNVQLSWTYNLDFR
ncbi:MAG: hypothetical protein COA38_10450 [Fluviicola sp.]|nr:MAG: hypothetical protein COA38_10450 [Fluviicola sp.]